MCQHRKVKTEATQDQQVRHIRVLHCLTGSQPLLVIKLEQLIKQIQRLERLQ
jgi:predicted transcriptional regulator